MVQRLLMDFGSRSCLFRGVLSSRKETKGSRILNPIPSGSWGTAIFGQAPIRNQIVATSMDIGANKNLACDDIEAHAKYLVSLIRLCKE